MNIAIIGSRTYPDLDAVRQYVRSLPADTVVVSGGADGVDSAAELEAIRRGLKTRIFRAAWSEHGKSAGMIRNHDIIKSADRVVVFWDGVSRGSANSIELCRRYGKPVEIHYADGRVEQRSNLIE